MKVVIAGGGVIGCAIAYYLAKAGADVTVLERGNIAQEASSASAGMLLAPFDPDAPNALVRLQRASFEMYPKLVNELTEESGIDLEYKLCGLIRPARDEKQAEHLKALARRKSNQKAGAEWVEGSILRELEPALSEGLIGAAFSPNDSDLNPGLLTRAFAKAAANCGASIRRRVAFAGFVSSGHKLTGIKAGNRSLDEFDAIVLAAGSWTRALAERLSASVPTIPIRGQMIAYRSKALHHAVWGEDGYLVPKARGMLFAGATVEDVGFRTRTTSQGIGALRAMAGKLVPVLRQRETASEWAGLRPGSRDGLPIIGKLPKRDNVFVATGHFRSGILLAPVTGKLMSELIVEGKTSSSLDPFSPRRFAR